MKPSSVDIAIAIGKAAAGNWTDPVDSPINWSCELYDPDGKRVSDGNGCTIAEAAAFAWLAHWAPDALNWAR